jgi:hypothetical protein
MTPARPGTIAYLDQHRAGDDRAPPAIGHGILSQGPEALATSTTTPPIERATPRASPWSAPRRSLKSCDDHADTRARRSPRMKVATANEHLTRILPPKTEKEFEAAWKKTEELRKWVDHGSDPQVDKDRFGQAVSRKQEELESYWRSRRSA